MIEAWSYFVHDDMITPVQHREEGSEVRLVPGSKAKRRFLADETGQLVLELFVQVERPVHET